MRPIFASILLLCGVAYGADPPPSVKAPAAPAVVVTVPDGPTTTPIPQPNGALPVSAAQTYIVQATAPVIIRGVPKGLVNVSLDQQTAGESIKIKGFLIVAPSKPGGTDGLDGSKFVTRTFTDPCVYSITAVGAGVCTLTIITGTDESTDIVRMLAVGGAPVPPTPPTPVDPLTAAFQAAYMKEADPAKSTKAAHYGAVFRQIAALTPTSSPPIPATAGAMNAMISSLVHDPAIGYPIGDIPLLSAVVQAEEKTFFGTDPSRVLDPAATVKELLHIASAIGGAK